MFYLIITIIVFNYLFDKWLDYLNNNNWNAELPKEAEGIYDAEKYKKAREYHLVSDKFANITSTFSLVLMLSMLLFKGFAAIDELAKSYSDNPILIAIIFFGIIGIASDLLDIPFDLYDTFVIEEQFGFNKTTPKTYILDKLKGYALSAIIGGGLLALVVWFYEFTGEYFWIYVWATMSLFMILATMFYASIILPMFNKLTPLADGDLRTAIQEYCKKVDFKLDNLFVMDGSKRSAKSNAFFSGLGSRKRIVLYDTLVANHTTEELVAVLAHEIGHYKKKHTRSAIILSVIQTGMMLFILSLFIKSPVLSGALGVSQPSFHIGILAFSMLYSPLSMVLGIGMNMLSRKNEFEADRFAKETYDTIPMMNALKKLSVDNLSNLTPHPTYVFFTYSHPPLLERLRALGK